MEALERRGNLIAALSLFFVVLWSRCNVVEGQRNTTRMSYVCPPGFVRLGHSCYFLSETKATWQNAMYACQDKFSNLTVPARWEDRNLRNYLNNPGVAKESRWIGGIYDNNIHAWKWGGELKRMHYQSFSKMKKMTPNELQMHCIAMMPELLYRWSPRSCMELRQYICQTKLEKIPKPKVKEYHRRWLRMGTINEINAPGSQEVNDPMVNDVTNMPVLNPKSYDLQQNRGGQKRHGQRGSGMRKPKTDSRPNDLKKRSRPAHRRLTRPFPGYQWNRRDPEGSYQRNAEILRSGRTGLSPQQIKAHLARLQHLRDRQIARRKRLRNRGEWLSSDPKAVLAQSQARTYMVDNNISALHPKIIVEEFMIPPPPPVPVPTRSTRG